MRKLIFALLLCNQSFAQIKHGYVRDVDSTGAITIMSTADTLSNGDNPCAILSMILNQENTNYYFLLIKFKAPADLSLNKDCKMQIKSKRGKITYFVYWGPDEYVNQGDYVSFGCNVSEEVLKNLKKSKTVSLTLLKDDFIHTINVMPEFKRKIGRLSEFLLTVDVYKEKELTWSEMTQFQFPEN